MKKPFVSFLLLICFAVPAVATQFVEIGSNDAEAVFIDKDSIESRGDHFVVWVKIAPLGERKKELEAQYKTTVSHALALFALNPELRQMQLLSYVVYDGKDNALEIESINR